MKAIETILKKNALIDVYKFFFILGIVCLHSSIIFTETYFVRCYLGVEFFFMISGLFLARSYFCYPARSSFQWIVGKAKRIYPIFLPSLLLLLLAKFVFLFSSVAEMSWKEFLIENSAIFYEIFFLNRSGLNYYMLNPPDWFLSAMILTGFVLYNLLKFLNRTILHCFLLVGIIYFTYYIIQTAGSLDVHTGVVAGFVDISLLRSFVSMSVGIEVFFLMKHLPVLRNYYLASLIEGMLLLGCLGVFINQKHSSTDWIVLFLFPLLIWSCYACRGFFHDLLSKRIFIYLGQFSTSLYLTHWFVNQYGQFVWGSYWSIGIYVFFSLCFAVLFQKLLNNIVKI